MALSYMWRLALAMCALCAMAQGSSLRVAQRLVAGNSGSFSLLSKRRPPPVLTRQYVFADYVRDFGRSYVEPHEYLRRSALFDASFLEIQRVNARNVEQGRAWTAGIHPFMDWTPVELQTLKGYRRPSGHGDQQFASTPASKAMLQFDQGGSPNHANDTDVFNLKTMQALQSIAAFHAPGALSGGKIRVQGTCGSCWAIAAVEAVEEQLRRSGEDPGQLSVQAILDCAANQQHCGGSGGCGGGTAATALQYIQDHGIPSEEELPYAGTASTCPVDDSKGPWPSKRRVTLMGFSQLPSNQAAPLEVALTTQGPAVVNVDSSGWHHYLDGIFDSCDKNAVLDHTVLAKGFGKDGNRKYWLIQNSWGQAWGEEGSIRLARPDEEDAWCGTDSQPQKGTGCDGGPPDVKVCGMCGVLYEATVPVGAQLSQ